MAPPRAAYRTLAALLDLLAEALLEPGADVRARAAALLPAVHAHPALAPVTEALAGFATTVEGPSEVEYVRLFLHGLPCTAHPYESFYRTGLLADPDCLADLVTLFEAVGVQPGTPRTVPVDHLGLQLDLLALLLSGLGDASEERAIRAEVARLARRLLDDHLRKFVASFALRVDGARPAPYLGAVVTAVAAAVAAASDQLRREDLLVSFDHHLASAGRVVDHAAPPRCKDEPR